MQMFCLRYASHEYIFNWRMEGGEKDRKASEDGENLYILHVEQIVW